MESPDGSLQRLLALDKTYDNYYDRADAAASILGLSLYEKNATTVLHGNYGRYEFVLRWVLDKLRSDKKALVTALLWRLLSRILKTLPQAKRDKWLKSSSVSGVVVQALSELFPECSITFAPSMEQPTSAHTSSKRKHEHLSDSTMVQTDTFTEIRGVLHAFKINMDLHTAGFFLQRWFSALVVVIDRIPTSGMSDPMRAEVMKGVHEEVQLAVDLWRETTRLLDEKEYRPVFDKTVVWSLLVLQILLKPSHQRTYRVLADLMQRELIDPLLTIALRGGPRSSSPEQDMLDTSTKDRFQRIFESVSEELVAKHGELSREQIGSAAAQRPEVLRTHLEALCAILSSTIELVLEKKQHRSPRERKLHGRWAGLIFQELLSIIEEGISGSNGVNRGHDEILMNGVPLNLMFETQLVLSMLRGINGDRDILSRTATMHIAKRYSGVAFSATPNSNRLIEPNVEILAEIIRLDPELFQGYGQADDSLSVTPVLQCATAWACGPASHVSGTRRELWVDQVVIPLINTQASNPQNIRHFSHDFREALRLVEGRFADPFLIWQHHRVRDALARMFENDPNFGELRRDLNTIADSVRRVVAGESVTTGTSNSDRRVFGSALVTLSIFLDIIRGDEVVNLLYAENVYHDLRLILQEALQTCHDDQELIILVLEAKTRLNERLARRFGAEIGPADSDSDFAAAALRLLNRRSGPDEVEGYDHQCHVALNLFFQECDRIRPIDGRGATERHKMLPELFLGPKKRGDFPTTIDPSAFVSRRIVEFCTIISEYPHIWRSLPHEMAIRVLELLGELPQSEVPEAIFTHLFGITKDTRTWWEYATGSRANRHEDSDMVTRQQNLERLSQYLAHPDHKIVLDGVVSKSIFEHLLGRIARRDSHIAVSQPPLSVAVVCELFRRTLEASTDLLEGTKHRDEASMLSDFKILSSMAVWADENAGVFGLEEFEVYERICQGFCHSLNSDDFANPKLLNSCNQFISSWTSLLADGKAIHAGTALAAPLLRALDQADKLKSLHGTLPVQVKSIFNIIKGKTTVTPSALLGCVNALESVPPEFWQEGRRKSEAIEERIASLTSRSVKNGLLTEVDAESAIEAYQFRKYIIQVEKTNPQSAISLSMELLQKDLHRSVYADVAIKFQQLLEQKDTTYVCALIMGQLNDALQHRRVSAIAMANIAMKALKSARDGSERIPDDEIPAIRSAFLQNIEVLRQTNDDRIFRGAMQLVQYVLTDKHWLVNQYTLEALLQVLHTICSSAASIKATRHGRNIYTEICKTLRIIIHSHRRSIGGRLHLITPLLQQLLACLFIRTSTGTSSRSRRNDQHPPWLSSKTQPLLPKHAQHFTRLITLLCNPPQSTVPGYRANSNRPQLTDVVREARVHVASMVSVLIHSFCDLSLHGNLGQGMKEVLNPALYAVFDVMDMAAPEDERVIALGASMNKQELSLLRKEHGEWKRFGRWHGA